MSEAPYKIHRGMRGDEVIDAVERTAYVRADVFAELQADVERKQTLLDDAKAVMERQVTRRKELEAQVLSLQSWQESIRAASSIGHVDMDAFDDPAEYYNAVLDRTEKHAEHLAAKLVEAITELRLISEYDCDQIHERHCSGCASCDARTALTKLQPAPLPGEST